MRESALENRVYKVEGGKLIEAKHALRGVSISSPDIDTHIHTHPTALKWTIHFRVKNAKPEVRECRLDCISLFPACVCVCVCVCVLS